MGNKSITSQSGRDESPVPRAPPVTLVIIWECGGRLSTKQEEIVSQGSLGIIYLVVADRNVSSSNSTMWLLRIGCELFHIGVPHFSAGLTCCGRSEELDFMHRWISLSWKHRLLAFAWRQGNCHVDALRHNLVDSASSHTLVSKIKPCMSKYKSFTVKLRMAHYISYSLFDSPLLLG